MVKWSIWSTIRPSGEIHACGLVELLVGEDYASNDQVVEATEVGEKLPVLILFIHATFAHDQFSLGVVFSHFGVHVP